MISSATIAAGYYTSVLNLTGSIGTRTEGAKDAKNQPTYTYPVSVANTGIAARKEVFTESEDRREFVRPGRKNVTAKYRLYVEVGKIVTENDVWVDTDGTHDILYKSPFDDKADPHHIELWLGITR